VHKNLCNLDRHICMAKSSHHAHFGSMEEQLDKKKKTTEEPKVCRREISFRFREILLVVGL